MHRFRILYYVAVVSLPHLKFVPPSCCFYWFRKQETEFEVASRGITSTPNNINIRPVVFELKRTDRHDQLFMLSCYAHV
jgi:hypothetical protein